MQIEKIEEYVPEKGGEKEYVPGAEALPAQSLQQLCSHFQLILLH